MRILALGCHPDDIEFGCGGTLIKYADKGHEVFMMVMTTGQAGGDEEIRRKEQEEAAVVMGIDSVIWGPYRDTELPLDQPIIREIEEKIDEIDPSFIFVHYRHDTHQDHRNLSMATITATRYTRNVLFFEGPTTQDFTPTVFVDIDEVMGRKISALQSHASQVGKTNIGDLDIVELAQASALFRGTQARIKAAEGFMPLRLFINVGGEEE